MHLFFFFFEEKKEKKRDLIEGGDGGNGLCVFFSFFLSFSIPITEKIHIIIYVVTYSVSVPKNKEPVAERQETRQRKKKSFLFFSFWAQGGIFFSSFLVAG